MNDLAYYRVVSAKQLIDAHQWSEFCIINGYIPYCINEGTMSEDHTFKIKQDTLEEIE